MSSKNAKKTFVVVNPEAGGGAGGRRWPAVVANLKKKIGVFDFEESRAVGHAREIAARAAASGYDVIVAYGGDGTVHEVVNGIVGNAEGRRGSRPALGVLCVGTGGDFIRTLRISGNTERQIETLAKGRRRRIDLGRVEYVNSRDEKESRCFINIASAGLSAEVLLRSGYFRSLFGKKLAYVSATLDAYRAWKPKKMDVRTDRGQSNGVDWPESLLCVAVANGRYFGGGMPIAPRSEPDDGLLDVVAVGPISPFKMPMTLSLLYAKQSGRLGNVRHGRAGLVQLSSPETIRLETDGELVGRLPATFEILPGALEVVTP